jgi:hypothetical protein
MSRPATARTAAGRVPMALHRAIWALGKYPADAGDPSSGGTSRQ